MIEQRTTTEANLQSLEIPSTQKQTSWYRPISVRKPFLIFAVLLPIALIVALEILQHISHRHDGFADIGPQTVPQALAEYIPSAVMLLFAALVSSIDSTIRILAPYGTLAKGNAPARRSILVNFAGKITIPALMDSLKERHLGVFLSTIAAALASFLTIVVAGLCTRDSVPVTHQVTVQRADQFNLTWNNSVASDNQAASIVSLIQHTNLSYPQWTFDELAFPTLKLPTGNESVTFTRSESCNERPTPGTEGRVELFTRPLSQHQRDDSKTMHEL